MCLYIKYTKAQKIRKKWGIYADKFDWLFAPRRTAVSRQGRFFG
jgi:hypothetical protein